MRDMDVTDRDTTPDGDRNASFRVLMAKAERVGAGRGLRRVQENRERLVKMDRATVLRGKFWPVPVVVYAVMVAAWGWLPALIVLVTGILALNALYGFARYPGGMTSLVIAAVTVMVSALLVVPALNQFGVSSNGYATGSSMFVAVLLPIVSLAGVYASRRWVPRRWTYVLAGCVGSQFLILLAIAHPVVGSGLAIVWVLAVVVAASGARVWWRAHRARRRSGITLSPVDREARHDADYGGWMSDQNIEVGLEAELRTAAHLLDLPREWTVIHSREVPGSEADIDHLAVGPGGVFLIDSKDWKGTIRSTLISPEEEPDDVLDDEPGDEPGEEPGYGVPIEAPVLDGHPERLPERLEATLFEAARVADVLNIGVQHVTVVVAFTDRMKMPDGPQELWLADVYDTRSGSTREACVHLMFAADLPEWLMNRPDVHWYRRSATGQAIDRLRGGVSKEVTDQRDRRYMSDLGVAADYMLPPRE